MPVWQIDAPTAGTIGGGGEPVRQVSLVLAAGRLDVVADETARAVHYEIAEVQGRPLWVSWDSGRLKFEQHKDPGSQWLDALKDLLSGPRAISARVVLTVPADVKVSVTSVNADVLVSGVSGKVSVNTVLGGVSLSRLGGVTRVKTVSSGIDASGLSGELHAKSMSGALTVDASPLRAVTVATVSGAARLDLTGAASVLTANAVSGDLTVRIPAHAGYDITAQSGSGRVIVDGHPLGEQNQDAEGDHRFDGDRAFAVKARSVSGDVVLLRGPSLVAREPRPPLFDAGRGDVQDSRPSDRPADGGSDRGADVRAEEPGETPPGTGGHAGWEHR